MNKLISNKIKYLYLIFTIGIVIAHFGWNDGVNIKYLNIFDKGLVSLFLDFAKHCGFISICYFIFMSAFWFFKGLDSYKEWYIRYKKRIKTLLIPFLLWNVIVAIYMLLTNQITINFNNIFYYLFESPVCGPLWYLLALLIYQLFAPILFTFKKNKKITTIIFIFLFVYFILRKFGVIPYLFTFKNWWWYGNLFYYANIYLIGAYIGLYYPNLIIEKQYNSKKYTIIGIVLIVLSLFCWASFHFDPLYVSFSILELTGIWFILKSNYFKRPIPKYLNCEFYIFALHQPVFIALTSKLILKIFKGVNLSGIEFLLIKLCQLIIILLSCWIISQLVRRFLPKCVNKYLTGGR